MLFNGRLYHLMYLIHSSFLAQNGALKSLLKEKIVYVCD